MLKPSREFSANYLNPKQEVRMQARHVPPLGTKYWTALILASIFGANTGDFLSDVLGLGHIAGLPFLAVLFALVIIAERFDSFKHTA